jgi:membrane fusion protein (multidrug efflux system)
MLSRVQKGTPVVFEVEGSGSGKGAGQIAVVFPDVDEATRSFRCKVLVDNAGLKYRPGMLVRVRIVNDRKDALLLPPRALSQSAEGWQVQVAKDGQPVWRKVEIGLQTEDAVEIRSGLKEGEQVLVSRDDD